MIYQTHGAANNDVLRVCGKDCDGMFLPAGPLLVAAQLPDSNPVKKSALAYVETYEKPTAPVRPTPSAAICGTPASWSWPPCPPR